MAIEAPLELKSFSFARQSLLGWLTSSLAEAIMALQTSHGSAFLTPRVIQSSNDPNMTVPFNLWGDAALCCCSILHAVASILMFAWQHSSGALSELLNLLIDVVDTGALHYLSLILNRKVDRDSLTAVGESYILLLKSFCLRHWV
jgi:hypothetical protein